MPTGLAMAFATVLALASNAGEPDIVKLEEARSLIAEAAQIERLDQGRRLTTAYAEAQRRDIRKGLVELRTSPGLEDAVGAALDAMDRRDAAALGSLSQSLIAKERALGRAG